MLVNTLFPNEPPLVIESTIEERFLKFHAENPRVYEVLVKLARRGKLAGKTTMGIKMLWEVMRWQMWLETSGEEFKLNNNYTSHYARLIMRQEPDLVGIFKTRN